MSTEKTTSEKTVKVKEFKTFELHNKPDFVGTMEKKKGINDLDPIAMQKAYDIIYRSWNRDEKGRNFIKHLIIAFLPIDSFHRLSTVGKEDLKCAILGYKLTGIGEVADKLSPVMVERMKCDAAAMVENRTQYTPDEVKRIQSMMKELPLEVQKMQIGYMSDKSDKVLLWESANALLVFSQNMLMENNDEVSNIIAKKYREANPLPEQKFEKPVKSSFNIGAVKEARKVENNLSGKSLNGLMQLKEQLEAKQS